MNNRLRRTFAPLATAAVLAVLASGCVFITGINVGGTSISGGQLVDLSADGRFVLYRTAEAIDPADTNTDWDVYRIDVTNDTAVWASARNLGGPGDGAVSAGGAMSADGRYITFGSTSTNLVSGDFNGASDVFVYDVSLDSTQRLTDGDADSGNPDISGDGQVVVYESAATDLVVGDTNGTTDVFSWVRSSGTTFRISEQSFGGQATGASLSPSINNNGTVAVYMSSAADLVPGDTNGAWDIFAAFSTGITARVSKTAGNGQATGGNSRYPEVSGNGSYFAFESDATNLVAGDTNGLRDVFVKSLTGAIERVSVDSSGTQATGASRWASISGDGDAVAFNTEAPELNGNQVGAVVSVVRDRSADTTTLMHTDIVNNPVGGGFGSLAGAAFAPHMSRDGHYVAIFDSGASPYPTTPISTAYLRWRSFPTFDSMSPSVVGNNVSTTVTITGSGFLGTASVATNPASPGSDGIFFSNVVVVDDNTTPTPPDVLGAPPSTKYVTITFESTGPGINTAALANCQCLTVPN
ncbi:MAG: TolB family protein [Acidimicrobiales bacterium]